MSQNALFIFTIRFSPSESSGDDTMDELKKSIKSDIECYYENTTDAPAFAHLHFVKDEIMAL